LIIPWHPSGASMAAGTGARNLLCTRPFGRSPCCCRPWFPLLENDTTRRSKAAGGPRRVGFKNGSAWTISPSNSSTVSCSARSTA
jgi:hypothetical protein